VLPRRREVKLSHETVERCRPRSTNAVFRKFIDYRTHDDRGMLIQARGVLVHAMSGTELSRVRTEFRLRLPETINKSRLESRGRHCYAIK
jgi:hypothetical protein